MNVVLVMFRENGERRSFSLTRDVTVIGRREDADFRIPLSDVSRKHSRLIKDGDTLLIEDLGSSNGTYHNGVRVQESEVHAGDTIQVGPIQFVVQIDGVPSEDELLGNSGAVSTHLANNNFATGAATGAAAAMGGAIHEESLADADELEELEEAEPLESADELEEVSELEEITDSGDDFVIAPVAVEEEEPLLVDDFVAAEEEPVAAPPEDDVLEEAPAAEVVTTSDLVSDADDIVAATDDLVTTTEEPVAALDDVAVAEREAGPAEVEGLPDSFDALEEIEATASPVRPATPTRPASPALADSTPTPAEDEMPLDEVVEIATTSEFVEGEEVAAVEPEAMNDFIDIDVDTDSGTGEDDVLIDFGDTDHQK